VLLTHASELIGVQQIKGGLAAIFDFVSTFEIWFGPDGLSATIIKQVKERFPSTRSLSETHKSGYSACVAKMVLSTLPAKLCTQLQTTSRAALANTALPYSVANLSITSILLRSGLISSMTLGSRVAPDPTNFTSLPPPDRRLWVNLKHRNGIPVLKSLELISKPSLRVTVDNKELGRILTGRRARNIEGVGMGEVLVMKVPRDKQGLRKGGDLYMEGWEAWRAGLGGEIICRAG
jgi:ribosomal protein S8